ncbi:unnamed protein product [Microthlaspi erraticum]|uniref:DNA (cytosine-5-)-methyltransferase n=1 Tax=Microthlaspi erraticum TaxID=1685480 RepID=A0A6D2IRP2_9BRAS|nr:unnamed protein product [Microthlaspi erraticum]
MVEHSASDDEGEIDNNLQWSPSRSQSARDGNEVDWSDDDMMAIDNFQWSPEHYNSVRPAGVETDETVARFIEMGFSEEMIAQLRKPMVRKFGANVDPAQILETLVKISASSEANSSKSKLIDELILMGFSEEMVIKVINEYGEENVDEITNVLLSYAEAEKLCKREDEDINIINLSDGENELNSSSEVSTLQALIKIGYPREEASIAIERCGETANVAEVTDFIAAARLAREYDDFFEEPIIQHSKKSRVDNEPSRRGRNPRMAMSSDHQLITLPNPMIGFGLPDGTGLMTERPDPIPAVACGPPYFYYENVAMAPKGVWTTISKELYNIKPEFVDSKYFCAAMRKRGYVHNLPIRNRFQILPLQHQKIQDVLPLTRKWWPSWDERTKLNCLVTCGGSATDTEKVRAELEKFDGKPPPHVQKALLVDCKKGNLVWVGKNRVALLEPEEIERLLGFPRDHTRGGGVNTTERFKSLGNSFQVDTVAYHLSVLKVLFPNGINVLSLFTGIGGGEVALHRLGIPMKVVVSVEISRVNRNILRSFWEQTNQEGTLIEITDVTELKTEEIEDLMERFGGFDLVIGGSPCNNLAGGNRVSRKGLEGEQSQLFYDYCRILKDVRNKEARMRRGGL